ncbi:hypothetical protein [Streptomyces venezuelae]|uniref:hypothetical protein n=1 Tax=Streptomyces venezuelae TaxID=54571 RepID=UPI001CC9907F|nr:hypothetical protein [Streptomyces venezuelae]
MDDLLMKLVSAAITGGLIALVGYASVARRRRQVARAEAGRTSTEDPTQAMLRHAEEADRARDELAAQGRHGEALDHARVAVDHWTALTQARVGRFQSERQAALRRFEQLRTSAGSA